MIGKLKKKLEVASLAIGILGGIIGLFVTIKSCSQPEKNTTSNIINSKGESSTAIIGNNNTVQRNNITVNNISTKEKTNKFSYSVLGTSNRKLLKALKNFNKIEIIPSAKNTIEITFTGDTLLLDKNSETYIYNGGNVAIKINNLNCYEFENLKISEMKPNSKNAIIKEIQINIDNYINNNPTLFFNKITECINKY